MIIVGSGVTEHVDAKSIYEQVGSFVEKNKDKFLTEEWNGYNILQRTASRTGAYEVGFTVPSSEVAQTKAKFVWLMGADEINEADIRMEVSTVTVAHSLLTLSYLVPHTPRSRSHTSTLRAACR